LLIVANDSHCLSGVNGYSFKANVLGAVLINFWPALIFLIQRS